ncbi:MAG: D-alanine--D-alanine ligase [Solirubrobacterales bacterium]
MKVAVLKGGASMERQVSLRSGARIAEALRAGGHEVVEIDVDQSLVLNLREAAPDAAFIALHGRGGEDGTVQELLEIVGIPYTGCGVLSSAWTMDKSLTKSLLQKHGVPTPRFVAFGESAFKSLGASDALDQIESLLGFPVVVKPARQGSALGVNFAADHSEMPPAILSAFSYDDKLLIEQFVKGREVAVSVLDGEALPAVEAIVRGGDFYDFESRYEIGKTDYVCPAEIDDAVAKRLSAIAVETFTLLGCHGFARVDFMLPENGEPQVLEVNSIPGLTQTSLMPMAAEAAGISFEQLAERLLATAQSRQAYPIG